MFYSLGNLPHTQSLCHASGTKIVGHYPCQRPSRPTFFQSYRNVWVKDSAGFRHISTRIVIKSVPVHSKRTFNCPTCGRRLVAGRVWTDYQTGTDTWYVRPHAVPKSTKRKLKQRGKWRKRGKKHRRRHSK